MKMRVVYRKDGRLRHVGHLDLTRAMQRALRRSGLPVAYSQGFNPHMLITFAAPLAVGIDGHNEVMDVRLERPVAQKDFAEAFQAALPQGLYLVSCRQVGDGHPAPMALLAAAEYEIVPLTATEELLDAVPGFLERESILARHRTKKGEKTFDLRPLVINILTKGDRLRAVLALRESGTLRPEVLLSSLSAFGGIPVPRCRIARTRLYAQDFRPLEEA